MLVSYRLGAGRRWLRLAVSSGLVAAFVFLLPALTSDAYARGSQAHARSTSAKAAASTACTMIGAGVITFGGAQIHVENSLTTDTTKTETMVIRSLTGEPRFFRLTGLTSASCSDLTTFPPEETGAPVNTFTAAGAGDFGKSQSSNASGYTISFTLGDYGDSTTGPDNTKADELSFTITYTKTGKVVWQASSTFTSGSEEIQQAAAVAPGSCEPSSSLSAMVQGKNVSSYVPKGNWDFQAADTGVDAVSVEGTPITNTNIPTPNAANSCASNPNTGVTVCVSNGTDVYLFSGTTLTNTLTDGGSGTISFSGGDCTTCSVAMDATHNQAVLGISVGGSPGYQFLNLASDTFGTPIVSPAGDISEDPLIDPVHNWLLSASEDGNYEIGNVANPASPAFYENATGAGELDSAGEDCSTGIALASIEFTGNLYIADLTQATFTAGSPGTWTAPSQVQTIPGADTLGAGTTGLAVAQGTHTAITTGEFGGSNIVALALPTTSGSGTPSITNSVECGLPDTPDGLPFEQGDDPHTVTAYQSPNTGDAIALVANEGATWLGVVDLTQMLNPTDVPASGGVCTAGTLPSSVVSYIALP